MAFNLNLTFGPQWENVSNIRTFVSEMLSSGIVHTNDAKKVATASSELVENVVKYSVRGGAIIEIKKDPDQGKIFLTLKNITSRENLDTFEKIFRKVTQGDAKEMYKTMMLRSFNEPENSQLGLARIRYECQAKMSYEISDDTRLFSSLSSSEDAQTGLKVLSVTAQIPVQLIGQ